VAVEFIGGGDRNTEGKRPTCLNGGGQQFYKYQQIEQPPLTSNQ
jgi:hypothetical protein